MRGEWQCEVTQRRMIHAGVGDTIEPFRNARRFYTVRELIQQYFNIAFLMGKPQDLPAGRAQLKIGVALAVVSYVMALAVPFGVERAFLQAVIDLGCTGLAIWIALSIVGHPGRFEQAFGGLCGASLFINLAAVPLFALRPTGLESANDGIGTLADFVLLVWGMSLMAHVIRHTFEVRMFFSVVMAVTYFIVLSTIIASLWQPVAPVTESGAVSFRTQAPNRSIEDQGGSIWVIAT